MSNSYWHMMANELPKIKIARLENDWSGSSVATLYFLDNYDQDVRQSGNYLVRFQDQYRIANDDEFSVCVSHKFVDFAAQIEDELLRSLLSKLIGLRKLEANIKLKVTQYSLALRDDERKCVARANVLCSETSVYVNAIAIRGYSKAYGQLCKQLTKIGFQQSQRFTFAQLFHDNIGLLPDIPNTQQYLPEPEDKLGTAVRNMCVAMINTARSHEFGVIEKSEDTEYLHDYRVSMRKTRSLLSLMKILFATSEHISIKQRLSDIMAPTNRARDLDVYLLQQSEYEALLPENLREGLPLMFDDFRKQHSAAYKSLKTRLTGDVYQKEIESCKSWIEQQKLDDLSEIASSPVVQVINKLAQKKYRKIIRTGIVISPLSPDDDVHELRLECKKFRYLLSFFGSIYPEHDLKRLIKKLKRMQNTLGLFNDYSVQQGALHEYLANSRQNKKIHVSVGALILVLAQKQQEQRQLVEAKFAEFASDETAQLVESLFSDKKSHSEKPETLKSPQELVPSFEDPSSKPSSSLKSGSSINTGSSSKTGSLKKQTAPKSTIKNTSKKKNKSKNKKQEVKA